MPQATEELRIVMVGKTGAGKSASGNTILGQKSFKSRMSSKVRATVDGQQVAIIDTPGLFDTSKDADTISKNISQCISFACPGPHVFLIVIALGRFTEEEMKTVQQIQKLFGDAADTYSMVLFTRGDELQETTIEEFIEDSPDLQGLVGRCHGQYHVFNNRQETGAQVTELLQKIRNIVEENGGSHYTNEMFQEAERAIEEEKQRILKEKEEEMLKEKEQLKNEMQAEFDEMLKKAQVENEAEIAELKAQNEKELKAREKALEEMYERNARQNAEMRNPVNGFFDFVCNTASGVLNPMGRALGGAIGSILGGAADAFGSKKSFFSGL